MKRGKQGSVSTKPSAKDDEKWLDSVVLRLIEECGDTGSAKEAKEAAVRASQLSTSSDRVGVCFKGGAFQRSYLQRVFKRRAMLLRELCLELDVGELLRPGGGEGGNKKGRSISLPKGLQVCSFGSGPGCAEAGLAALSRNKLLGCAVSSYTLFDKETTWKRYAKILTDEFKAPVTIFPCDVTQPIVACAANFKAAHGQCVEWGITEEDGCGGGEGGAAEDLATSAEGFGSGEDGRSAGTAHIVSGMLPCADLFVFFYVCHETSALSERSGWEFYKQLAASAKAGSVVVSAIHAVIASSDQKRPLLQLASAVTFLVWA